MIRKGMMLAFIGATLVGCGTGSVKEKLGLKMSAPDEFMVVSRPSLVTPPDFTLPEPGTKAAAQSTARQQARTTLLGSAGQRNNAGSQAENALLGKAGAVSADASIRAVIDAENQVKKEDESGLLSGLVASLNKEENIINADEEAKRLKEAEAPAAE